LFTGGIQPSSSSAARPNVVSAPLACSASAAESSSTTPAWAITRVAGVEVPGDRDALGRGGDVGVVEDDHRCLPAQFQVSALEVAARADGDCSPGPHRSGDRHHLRGGVGDECRAGGPVAADDV
jgi:hypothetical protein